MTNGPSTSRGDWAVQLRGVGKRYRLGAGRAHDSLREGLMEGLRGLVRGSATPGETFWAVRGVDLDVARGETLGIIGRNGAGKSTMLKLLSRITPPTEGEIRYRGRLASLLEVGTGFHRELTGRENVFLNGAILGMRREEIARRFDEIVAFSGIERFLDTPVKFYSSGMYVRLAFAVAAHLRTDILVVDEVLAVGDAAFQKKCLGKMQDAATDGRTVLFVSHNMTALQRLCARAVWLEEGRIELAGDAADVVRRYLERGRTDDRVDVDAAERHGTHGEQVRVCACVLRSSGGDETTALAFGEPFTLEVTLRCPATEPVEDISIVVGIDSWADQTRLASCASEDRGLIVRMAPGERRRFVLNFDDPCLAPGNYAITLALRTGRQSILDRVPQCLAFEVMDVPHPGRVLPSFLAGAFRLNPEWEEG